MAVCERLESLRAGFASDFGLRAYADWKELLAAETIDLAYIWLPHDECPAAAMACAEKGVNVVVEKPVANTAQRRPRDRRGLPPPRGSVQHAVRLAVSPGLPGNEEVHRVRRVRTDRGLRRALRRRRPVPLYRRPRPLDARSQEKRRRADVQPRRALDRSLPLAPGERNCGRDRQERPRQPAYDIEDNSFAICTFQSGATLALDISYTVPDSYPFGRDLYLAIRGTEGCMSFAPAFEGTRQTLFVCSNDPRFGGERPQDDPIRVGQYAGLQRVARAGVRG